MNKSVVSILITSLFMSISQCGALTDAQIKQSREFEKKFWDSAKIIFYTHSSKKKASCVLKFDRNILGPKATEANKEVWNEKIDKLEATIKELETIDKDNKNILTQLSEKIKRLTPKMAAMSDKVQEFSDKINQIPGPQGDASQGHVWVKISYLKNELYPQLLSIYLESNGIVESSEE